MTPPTTPTGRSPRTAFVFAGQGAQYYGMGRRLREADPVFRRSLDVLGEMFADHGLSDLVRRVVHPDDGVHGPMNDIRMSHPGIVMVELALFDALTERGVEPDLLVGSSLGEFAALAAGGGIDREDLVAALTAQVEVLERECPPGGMLAVLAQPSYFTERDVDWRSVELAAVNTAQHFVVSGSAHDIERVGADLRTRGVTVQVLPVDYAFHSSLIDPIRAHFEASVARSDLRPTRVPLVSATTASVATATAEHLWGVVRNPIRWQETVAGLESAPEHLHRYVDLTPSGSMNGFLLAELDPAAERSRALIGPFRPEQPVLDAVAELGIRPTPTPPKAPIPPRGPTSPKGPRMRAPSSNGIGEDVVTTAVLFPGQGSQRRGMGRDLFAAYPDLVREADEVLGYSIERICVEDPDGQLTQTQFAQPALFVVNALSYQALLDAGEIDPGRVLFAGHSLGEYSALSAAGVLTFRDGVRTVQERGRLMALATGGGMAAVIGLPEAEVARVLQSAGFDDIDVANINSPDQVVVSGPRERVLEARAAVAEAGARFAPLPVSGAFHSRQMQAARPEFERFLADVPFAPPRGTVLANVTAEPYSDRPRELLGEQLVRPVRWLELVRRILEHGITDLREVGPGTVLTKLATAIRDQTPVPATVPATAPAVPTAAPAVPTAAQAVPATAQAVPTAARAVPAAAGNGVAAAAVNGVAAAAGNGARAGTGSGVQVLDRRPAGGTGPGQEAGTLGSAAFRRDHGVDLAYVCGAMYRGIASEALVRRAAEAGILSFFGAGGLKATDVADAVDRLTGALPDRPFGVNVVHDALTPAVEEALVDVCLAKRVRRISASAFIKVTPALARYRVSGLRRAPDGGTDIGHRILAKVSRPEVAAEFLAPPPPELVADLLRRGAVTAEQAELAARVPMVDDLCCEADSGGHTDRRNPLVLYPAILVERDRAQRRFGYRTPVRVGIAGGIGTPHAAAGAFAMGADFVIAGSINLCTVEAGISDLVKDLLQTINIQDTDYAPAGDMFEYGAQVQVLRRGVFFPARARKLHELYRNHNSLDDLPPDVRELLETRYFRRSLAEVWAETERYFADVHPEQVRRAAEDPRHKMALVFRWYFGHSQRAAMSGVAANKLDFQVHCGPALGAFNQWVSDTPLASWRERHVDDLARRIMAGAWEILSTRPDGRGGQ